MDEIQKRSFGAGKQTDSVKPVFLKIRLSNHKSQLLIHRTDYKIAVVPDGLKEADPGLLPGKV
jgi:hypothetical protein